MKNCKSLFNGWIFSTDSIYPLYRVKYLDVTFSFFFPFSTKNIGFICISSGYKHKKMKTKQTDDIFLPYMPKSFTQTSNILHAPHTCLNLGLLPRSPTLPHFIRSARINKHMQVLLIAVFLYYFYVLHF